MDELSAELRARREALGLTLDDIFKQTRINVSFLEALEAGRFEGLPDTYIQLFLKTYAQELGLDPEEILSRYLVQKHPAPRSRPGRSRQTGSMGPALAIAGALALIVGIGIWMLRDRPADPLERVPDALPAPAPTASASTFSPTAKPALPTTAREISEAPLPSNGEIQEDSGRPEPESLVREDLRAEAPRQDAKLEPAGREDLQITMVGSNAEDSESPAVREEAIETPVAEQLTPSPPPRPQDRILEAYSISPPLTVQDSVLTLTGLALEATGVVIAADGETVFSGALSPGNRQTWQARDRFRIEVQKATALSLFLKGHELKPLGSPGRKLRVFITRASIWIEELAPTKPLPKTVVDL